ncbi:type III secretion system chaperone [Methylobacterium oryzihabitans]|uniref:Type III secretion system chaperone n=1 Tax=Methylobacterium oryzihabitans TaxID=2499852 RepID=A0A3S2VR74_9HYPH|nr:type III secretion system chaperone [Methylobacterium oryzihabitans]RVU15279.1 hypothetical protein EOE48_19780 [Methylobacterium oryzihabitans]
MERVLEEIMSQIGPMDDDIQTVLRMTDGRWIVRFGEIDVEVEHDPATNRLMFSTLIAPVPPGRAAEVLEALLLYAMAWRETGGVRMALNGPGGAVVQMADVFAPDADARTVVTVARNLAGRVPFWHDFLVAQSQAAGAPQAGAPGSFAFETMIRG